jgi:hypothetical protein
VTWVIFPSLKTSHFLSNTAGTCPLILRANCRNKNRKFERLSKEHERNIFPLLQEKKEENKTIANVSIKIEPLDESYECTSSSIGQINSNLNGVFTNSRDSILRFCIVTVIVFQ